MKTNAFKRQIELPIFTPHACAPHAVLPSYSGPLPEWVDWLGKEFFCGFPYCGKRFERKGHFIFPISRDGHLSNN